MISDNSESLESNVAQPRFREDIRTLWKRSAKKALEQESAANTTPLSRVISRANSLKGMQSQSLTEQYKALYQEHAKLKRILEMLKGEYEESKNYEIFRRYSKLKGMVKRTVMYTKLETLPDVTCALGMGGLVMMSTGLNRKTAMSMIPDVPKSELADRIKQTKRRISLMRSQIEQLSEEYDMSKQYIVFQRYRLMKSMVKQMLQNCED